MSKFSQHNFDWVICIGVPYNPLSMQSTGNIMREFYALNKKILWVNPMIKINKKYSSNSAAKKNHFLILKKISRKIRLYIKPYQKVETGFIVLSPLTIPISRKKSFDKLNKVLLNAQIQLVFKLLKIRNPLLYSSGYLEAELMQDIIQYEYWFHEFPDLDSDNRNITEAQKTKIKRIEEKIINSADLVVASSKRIYDKVLNKVSEDKKKENIIYFPHGVDFAHFHNAKASSTNFEKLKKPIIGYFGSLTQANDQEVYLRIANAGYSLLLIGEVLGDYSDCRSNSNIVFTGPINYKELPSVVKNIDIGIMAWKPSEHILNSNPKKTLEYLCCGIPIVSMRIPQLLYEYGDLLYYADSPDEFIEKIELALKENDLNKINFRIKKAMESEWSSKVKNLFKI